MRRQRRMPRRWALPTALLVMVGVVIVGWQIVDAARTSGRPARAAEQEAGPPTLRTNVEALEVPSGSESDGTIERPVAGVALRPDGQPAFGARVTLMRALSPWPEWRRETIETTVTTVGGEFRFRTQRGPDLLVAFEHRDFAGHLVEAPPAVPRLILRLQHGFTVSGHVAREGGMRVPGCRVTLEPTLGVPRRAVSTETGTDGTFRFDNVAAGSLRVVARHSWWQPAVLPLVTVGASRGLELRFAAPALTVEGRVVTAGSPQRPVAGARVRALPNVNYRDLFDPVEVVTDGQGVFRVQGVGQGNLRLEVRHPEWSTGSRSLAVSGSPAQVNFELLPRAQVHGILRGIETAVVPGIVVELVMRSTAGEMARCAVANDGTFAFAGTFSLANATLEAAGGAFAFARTSGADVLVRIEEGARTELDLDVLPASAVRGRVVDPDGRPLAGAQLVISQEYLRLPAPDRVLAVSDVAGRFEIRGLAVRPVTIQVRHDRYATARAEVEVTSAGAHVEVPDIMLQHGGRIAGRVLRGNEPLPGALVLATGGGNSGAAVSQSDGRFLITDLPADNYRVKARYSTMPLAFAESEVPVSPDRTPDPVELRFPAGRVVAGMVTGRDGQPVEGASVSVRGLAGSGVPIVTDASGSYSIEVPPRAVDLLVATADGGVQAVETVAATIAVANISLDVPPMATVTARLFAVPGKRPLGAGLVRVVPRDTVAGGRPHTRWFELPSGVLRHPFVPAQSSRLTIHCEGYVPFVTDVDLPAGGELALGDILLEPGAAVRGTVIDEAGQPVAGCAIFLGSESDLREFLPQLRTAADGGFEVRGVSTAASTLVASAPGFAPRTVHLDLPRDVLKRSLSITLQRGIRLEIVAAGAEGQVVVLTRDDAVVAVSEVDESGIAVFQNRGPGDYEAYLFGSPDRRTGVEVGKSGELHRVELR